MALDLAGEKSSSAGAMNRGPAQIAEKRTFIPSKGPGGSIPGPSACKSSR
jgi:hypothetical protein